MGQPSGDSSDREERRPLEAKCRILQTGGSGRVVGGYMWGPSNRELPSWTTFRIL
jgi:hypothetical protein